MSIETGQFGREKNIEKTIELKFNALLSLTLESVPKEVYFDDEKLERKNEFHLTLLSFGAQEILKDTGADLNEVGDFIKNYLNEIGINLELSDKDPIVLSKEYKEYNAFERSVIVLLEQEEWMKDVIGELEKKYNVVLPKIYPHITTHSLNGRGIAINSQEELEEYEIGELENNFNIKISL